MASAQVLSNSAVSSRKQAQLEAGKRRLEEFRKKKAAAKKALPSGQPRSDVTTANEKQTLENGQAQMVNSFGAVADRKSDSIPETSGSVVYDDKYHGSAHDNGSDVVQVADANSYGHNFVSSDALQMQPEQDRNSHNVSDLKSQTGFIKAAQRDDTNGKFGTDTEERRYADAVSSTGRHAFEDYNSSYFHSAIYGSKGSHSNKDAGSFVIQPDVNALANDVPAKAYAEGHATQLSYTDEPDFGRSEYGVLEFKNQWTSGSEDRKPSNAVNNLSSFFSQQASEPSSAGFDSGYRGSFDVPSYSVAPETHSRRSRPSFLDSLDIGKDSQTSGRSYSEQEKLMTSKFPSSNFIAPSPMHDHSTPAAPLEPLPTPVSSNSSADIFGNASRRHKLFENSLESKLESTRQKQNEDFAALEQHIEDLTQEKFSLQRALEASKALAESLASENSSLTESYNQQASIVNQLKADMENLQEEIKARVVELESFKVEYMNAQLECTAADERAKLLASEVIGLEEKALRLRSNELKLERELENASAENASYKKKLSTFEKERRDLMQTIDALQEEKKLLKSKFRRASAGGATLDINKGHLKRDVSTSTDDLGPGTDGGDVDNSGQIISSLQVHEGGDNLLFGDRRPAVLNDLALNIPSDQMQMIQNINSLISEIMAEREELMQALVTEVSTTTKLKDLNKELSQKLEIQTQRLELLTAQSMVNENIPVRQPKESHVTRESVAYADEGDEVVERVLGWIMKLFPGGPSKRRTSRL